MRLAPLLSRTLLLAAALLPLPSSGAHAQSTPQTATPTHVAFGLDWRAEAEYGGYYQAKAQGIYQRYGLDVEIRQGGPQINQAQLLLSGKLDFDLASNSFLALNLAQQNLPFRAVAAFFQKDPAVLIAHPGQGPGGSNDSFETLKGKPIMIGADSRVGWWNFLRARFGYSDSQIRPYAFSLAPFLADPKAVQQGYLGSEPFVIQQQTGTAPVVLLLADAGFNGYGSLLTTSDKLIAANPDLIARFIKASAEGWDSYLNGDPAPANQLILQANPDILAFGRKALKEHQIVQVPGTPVGAMNTARWQDFYQSMSKAGVFPANLAWQNAFTQQFNAP